MCFTSLKDYLTLGNFSRDQIQIPEANQQDGDSIQYEILADLCEQCLGGHHMEFTISHYVNVKEEYFVVLIKAPTG